MANPHQQFNFNARPQYPTTAQQQPGMNMNMAGMNPAAAMNLNMGGMPNMGGMQPMGNMNSMAGMVGTPQMQNPLLNQYQMQMRAQQQQQGGHPSTPSQQGYPGAMGMPTQQQQPGGGAGGMSISMPQTGFPMNTMGGGGGMSMMGGMKPQAYQQQAQQPQGYPAQQHPQYNISQGGQYGAAPHQSPYPGQPQQLQYGGAPQQQQQAYGAAQPGMGYPQHTPTPQPTHPGQPPTPSQQPQQPQQQSQQQQGGNPMYPPGMNIPQTMGYPPQNGIMPGRPPSAMSNSGIQAPTPTMPGQVVGGGGGMKPPQTPTGHPSGTPGSMNPPSLMQQNGMPQQMGNLTPQQMMQIHQARQQQQQQRPQTPQQQQQSHQSQSDQMMDMSHPQMMHHSHPSMGGGSQHGGTPGSIQVQVPSGGGNQTQQPPSAGPQSARSSSVARSPTPTLPNNQNQNQTPTPVSSVPPGSAGGPMANRPPSAAAGSAPGMMHPPSSVPNKIGYPMGAGPTPGPGGPGGGGGMMPNGGAMGINLPNMNPAQLPTSQLNQLQMLGQQVGMAGVVMLNNPNAHPSTHLHPQQPPHQQHQPLHQSHQQQSQHQPQQQQPQHHPNGPSMGHPGMPGQGYTPSLSVTVGGGGGAGPTPGLRHMSSGLGPALGQPGRLTGTHGGTPSLGMGPNNGVGMPSMPGGALPGPMPLSTQTPTSSSSAGPPSSLVPNMNSGLPGVPPSSAPGMNMGNTGIGRPSDRSASRPPLVPPPSSSQAPAPPPPLAERTMSPRQRAALIPTITRVSSVPADDKDHPLEETLPDLTEDEIDRVAEWIGKDRKYEGEYRKMKENMTREMVESFSAHKAPPSAPGAAVAPPPTVGLGAKPIRWFEKDWREDANKRDKPSHYALLWPSRKSTEKESFFKKLGRKPVSLPKKVDSEAASKPEVLVPIRIDVDIGDGYNRLRDTFVWNMNDPYVTPMVFAQTICDDFSIGFGLGQSSEGAKRKFLDQVVSTIQEQIADFKNHRVEIEQNIAGGGAPKIAAPTPTPAVPSSKPVSTIGGSLTVNGLGREKSRSRSATPLPGERERSEKPVSSILKRVPSSTGLTVAAASENNYSNSKKRSRPANDGPNPNGLGKMEDDEEEWWERWRKRMRVLDGTGVLRHATRKSAATTTTTSKKLTSTASPRKSRSLKKKKSANLPNGVPMNGIKLEVNEVDTKKALIKIEEPDEYQRELLFVDDDEPEAPNAINEDLRILIKLDIAFGIRRLEDQFEWDISDKRNSPEQFAECYCTDLGLSGEFKTAIAHSIREQVQVYEKSLFLVGHPMDGTTIQDEDLRLAFLPSLNTCIRPLDQIATHTPQLNFFNETELEKTFDRGGPRKRRQPRGRRAGAVPLPDREPMKTFRTPMIGFPEVEKEKDTWVAPSRRQAAMVAERANAQIAVIESEQDIRTQPPFMGTIPPPNNLSSSHTPQSQQRPNPGHNAMAGTSQQKPAPELPQKKTRAELLQGPTVAKRVLRSRPVPKSTALNPEAPIPDYLRGYEEKPKSTEKKKNMYKDRELPEGLHPNMIDGVWHCSSCGCPEDIAIGRRQGPLGPKTMCGDCGKWWHRHRKPMDIIYRTDKEYHIERKKKEEEYRRLKKRGGMKAAQAAAAAIVDGRAAAAAQKQQASTSSNQSHGGGGGQSQPLFTTVPRPISGSNSHRAPPPKPLVVQSPESSLSPPPFTPQQPQAPNDRLLEPPREPPRSETPISPPAPPQPAEHDEPPVLPQHLVDEKARLNAAFPYALWEIIPKPRPIGAPPAPVEWRLKCTDCPGKLYNPGPDDTLKNFEIHLKNKAHRMNLYERLGIPWPHPAAQPATSAPVEHLTPTPTPTPSHPPQESVSAVSPSPAPVATSTTPMEIVEPTPAPPVVIVDEIPPPPQPTVEPETPQIPPVTIVTTMVENTPPPTIDVAPVAAASPIPAVPSPIPIKEASPIPPPSPSPSPGPAASSTPLEMPLTLETADIPPPVEDTTSAMIVDPQPEPQPQPDEAKVQNEGEGVTEGLD